MLYSAQAEATAAAERAADAAGAAAAGVRPPHGGFDTSEPHLSHTFAHPTLSQAAASAGIDPEVSAAIGAAAGAAAAAAVAVAGRGTRSPRFK